MTETLVRLSRLESAFGGAIGVHSAEPELPEVDPDVDPRAVLEQAVLPGLLRPPCVVAFSGGRDSSAVLAVATRVARREGLALPVPMTQVFPGLPDADESDWQELVIGHLGLTEWHRQDCGAEHNMLGPAAQRMIRRHGVIAPASGVSVLGLLAAAEHGALLTGGDGDGLFNGGSRARLRAVMGRRVPPRARDVLTVAKVAAPALLRRAWETRRSKLAAPWLRPDAAASVRSAYAQETSSEPLLWRNRIRWWARLRSLVLRRQALALLARDADVLPLDPFLDPTFLAAMAQRGGALGYGSRTDTMRTLFGDLLPEPILGREAKAVFNPVYWGGEVRTFVDGWDGTGVPTDIVDPEALRREWSRDSPLAGTALLLQAAWASGVGERKQPFNCSFH